MRINRNISESKMTRCEECNGKLTIDDDFEDVEYVGGRVELCLSCVKCDAEYTGTFMIEALNIEDE